MEDQTIFDFITTEITKYNQPITLEEGWDWSMKEHIRRSFLYLNSQFYEDNDNRHLRPFKNIVLPILNIQFRTEGFDVKDIELYVDNKDDYFKSLLVRKYHTKWALAEEIDTFIDEMVDSYATYGGALIRKTKKAKPEIVDLRSLAFANQHDILANPFGILHELSFSQLRERAEQLGWGTEGSDIDIESLISLVKKEGKDVVKVYEVHGNLPIEWLNDEDIVDESRKDVRQIQVVAEYMKPEGQKAGVTLFRKKMPKLPFKLIKRDTVENRALGRGGVEELFDAQEWTNQDEIWVTEMLDAASKNVFWSDDPSAKTNNNLNDIDNNEILSLQQGNKIQQLDTYPRNIAVFNDSIDRFWQHAQLVGAGPDALMGEEPTAGTPFKSYEAQQIEGKGLHKHRQGKIAVKMDELYRDWVLPYFKTEVVKEQNFMEQLSADEMADVVEQVMIKKTNEFKKRMILGLQPIDTDMVTLYEEKVRDDTIKKGSKRFFEILKEEMANLPIAVMTNIAGKQKNLNILTDKVVNVIRQYLATPELRNDPEMGKIVNMVLESSGLNPISIVPKPMPQQAPQQQPQGNTAGLQALGEGAMRGEQVNA